MEVIILAGGLGTRLRSVVNDRPKPMADINGKPFLAYLLAYWVKQGAEHFVLSVGYMHEAIENYFGNVFQGVPISYALEDEPLGTGGALLYAISKLNNVSEDCVVQNGDTFAELDVRAMMQVHQQNKADLTMALCRMNPQGRYSLVVVDEDASIKGFISNSDSQLDTVNAGVYILSPAKCKIYLDQFKKPYSLEQDAFPKMSQDVNMRAYLLKSDFIDIGLPEDLRRAGETLK